MSEKIGRLEAAHHAETKRNFRIFEERLLRFAIKELTLPGQMVTALESMGVALESLRGQVAKLEAKVAKLERENR